IRSAGSVKSRRSEKHAVSDWMEIEKQRGISVTSSVLQFEYNNYCINILDTPGHQDFSEDTYRTLVAADSAVMVIDCAKGVEAQTKKLFHVCKMRNIPIFTLINKMDRSGKDPFELIEELENVLGIRACPMNWPIGSGKEFRGVYNRKDEQVELFNGGDHGQSKSEVIKAHVSDQILSELLGDHMHQQLLADIELLDIAGDGFDLAKVLSGELTPVYFGSALTNFGVEPFLKSFLEITTPPRPRMSNLGYIDSESTNFTGFIFKIQANMNPTHRDRIAFLRICSGQFVKGMSVNLVQKGKKVKLAQPQQFLAQDRVITETAFPGDIIGIHDPGIFNIGDTLCEDNSNVIYEGIPQFAPEHFIKISTINALKRKHFVKGLNQLAEEGTVQIYKRPHSGVEELIIGVVGMLQFEVLDYRLKNEYGVETTHQQLPYQYIRWIEPETIDIDTLSIPADSILVFNDKEQPIILYSYEWSIRHLMYRYK
ncbi:MAG: peptide chain release factor 3, partial [Vallitaleaceae bacterium]|nr:peptide chain release factor 3 [Vallitaleaceae bacterium]